MPREPVAQADAEFERQARADPALMALVEAEQIRLIVEQARHVPVPHLVLDAFVAWLGWTAGIGYAAPIWLGVMAVAVVGRTVYLVRLDQGGDVDAQTMLSRQAWTLVAVGAVFATMMVMVFSRPPSETQYVLTMVLAGNAAGAVAVVAGHLRTYIRWATLYGGTLALCWLSRGTIQGVLFAALTVLLFVTLSLYVRDQGRTLLRQVALTEDLRRERDKQARLSEALRRERDRAERASEAKTRFFASASHDLRQPLTALSYHAATVQALAENSGDPTLTRIGEGIGRSLTESRALLDSLLEVSKLDAGAVEVQRKPVDVGALLSEIGDAFMAEAEERGIELRVRLPIGGTLLADTDPALVRRIVQNLVGNALKFTLRGKVTLQAKRTYAPETIEVRIVDTGIGIPPDAHERVFEEFYQVGNPARDRSRGLGLGLSIVRRLATLIGTRVDVRSTPGQGSTFRFELPAIPEADAALVPQDATTPGVRHAVSNERRRILVIDDEVGIRESVATMLGAFGWEVAAEAGAEEALLRVANGFEPDALIVDYRLRDATGLEALAALRGFGCRVPAWIITGETDPSRIAEIRAAGVPVIYKPVDGLQLAAMLRGALERST